MFTVCESRVLSHEMTHNSKHSNAGLSRLTKWLEILAGTTFHQNSSEITENDPISCIAFKNHRAKIKAICLSEQKEHRSNAVNARQRRQTSTEAVTKYQNYSANETEEEMEHRLQTRRESAANRIRNETDE